MEVAITEDQGSYSQLLSWYLISENLCKKVHLFKNGEDLLQGLTNLPINMIFLDLNMPVLNGFQTLERLKQLNSHIPVAILSGELTQGILGKLANYRIMDVISKSAGIESLQKITDCIGRNKKVLDQQKKKQLQDLKKSTVQLSLKEMEIIKLTGLGYTTAAIADYFHGKVKGIEKSKSVILKKTNQPTFSAVIYYMWQNKYFFSLPSDQSENTD
ncbi:response regulator [Myroides sp. LJL119]